MAQCAHCLRLLPDDLCACDRCGTAVAAWQAQAQTSFTPTRRPTGPLPAAVHEPATYDWQEGRVVHGRYELLKTLGEGGMGVVYLARDLSLMRQVALKVLDAELVAHPSARRRMEREAVALGRIAHQNVIGLYDTWDAQGRLVLVLEYVAGGTLTQHIGTDGAPLEHALYWLQGVLAGLQAIHDAGLIHRDIKPDNVLLTAASVAKLADLGVARDTQIQSQTRTRMGARLGTPHYMSPEQAQGEVVDVRSDIFSVGVLAFELLCGKKAFDGPSEIEVMSAVVREPPPLAWLDGRCPDSVVDIIAQALSKNVEERFGSARAMARALNAAT